MVCELSALLEIWWTREIFSSLWVWSFLWVVRVHIGGPRLVCYMALQRSNTPLAVTLFVRHDRLLTKKLLCSRGICFEDICSLCGLTWNLTFMLYVIVFGLGSYGFSYLILHIVFPFSKWNLAEIRLIVICILREGRDWSEGTGNISSMKWLPPFGVSRISYTWTWICSWICFGYYR